MIPSKKNRYLFFLIPSNICRFRFLQNSGKAERTELVFKKSKLRLQSPLSSAEAITKDNSDLNTDHSMVVTKDNSDLVAAESRVKNVLRKSEALKSAIINKLEQNDIITV